MTSRGQFVAVGAKADDQTLQMAPDVAKIYAELQVALKSLQKISVILERIALTMPGPDF